MCPNASEFLFGTDTDFPFNANQAVNLNHHMKDSIKSLFNEDSSLCGVIIDASPYYKTSQFETELWQALLFWQRKQDAITDNPAEYIKIYQASTQANLEIGLGIFHHPALSSINFEEKTTAPHAIWQTLNRFEGSYDDLFYQLIDKHYFTYENKIKPSVYQEFNVGTRKIDIDFSDRLVSCAYSFINFGDLKLTDDLTKFSKSRSERIESLSKIYQELRASDLIEKDFELIQTLYHKRLRTLLGLEEYTTNLLSIPLNIFCENHHNPQVLDEFDKQLPDNFLGVMWIILIHKPNSSEVTNIDINKSQAKRVAMTASTIIFPSIAINRSNAFSTVGKTQTRSGFAHQTSAIIDSILSSIKQLPEKTRDEMGWMLHARLYLLGATINSYRDKATRVNPGDFPYPWKNVENPLEVYRDIGIQLGLARAQAGRHDEPDVRIAGLSGSMPENQFGSLGFEHYRDMFMPLPGVSISVKKHLMHSNFAVLILQAIKQAFYHTIRARIRRNELVSIRMNVSEYNGEVIFECEIWNPMVTEDDINMQAKDAQELVELADRLSCIPCYSVDYTQEINSYSVRYSVNGPYFDKDKNQWVTKTRIHEEKTKGIYK